MTRYIFKKLVEEKERVFNSRMNENTIEMEDPPPYFSTMESETAKPINTQLSFSIFNLVFTLVCGCGGLPFSIAALVFSLNSKNYLELKLYDSAEKSSRISFLFNIISTVLTIFGLIIIILVVVFQVIWIKAAVDNVTNFTIRTTTSSLY